MKYCIRVFFAIAATALAVALCVSAPAGASEATALNNEAVDLFERGRIDEALEKAKVAVSLQPDDAALLANLGFIYQSLGRHQDAEGVLKKAIAIDPMNLDAHNTLAICLYYLGDPDRAISEWEWILKVDPANKTAQTNIALANGEQTALPPRKPNDGATPSTTALEEMFLKGKGLFKKGDYGDAVSTLNDVIEVKPSSMFSHYYAGLAYGRLGDREKAMRHLREYLILESYPPKSADAYNNASHTFNSLRSTGRMPEQGDFSASGAGKQFAKGKQAYQEKDFFRAIHYFAKALELKPDSFTSNYYIGLSFGAVGDRERAAYHLSRCLVMIGDDPDGRSKTKALILKALESLQ